MPLDPFEIQPYDCKPEICWENEWIKSRGDVNELAYRLKAANKKIEKLKHSDEEVNTLRELAEFLQANQYASLEAYAEAVDRRFDKVDSSKRQAEARLSEAGGEIKELVQACAEREEQAARIEEELRATFAYAGQMEKVIKEGTLQFDALQQEMSEAQSTIVELQASLESRIKSESELIAIVSNGGKKTAELEQRIAVTRKREKELEKNLSESIEKLAASREINESLEKTVTSTKLLASEWETATLEANKAHEDTQVRLKETIYSLEQTSELHSAANTRVEALQEQLAQQQAEWEQKTTRLAKENVLLEGKQTNLAENLSAVEKELSVKVEQIKALKLEVSLRLASHRDSYSLLETQTKASMAAKDELHVLNTELRQMLEENLNKLCQIEIEMGTYKEDLAQAQILAHEAQSCHHDDLEGYKREVSNLQQVVQDCEKSASVLRQRIKTESEERAKISAAYANSLEQVHMQAGSFQQIRANLEVEHAAKIKAIQRQVEQLELSGASLEEQNERNQELTTQLANTEALVRAKSNEISAMGDRIQALDSDRDKLMLRLETYVNLEVLGNDHVRQNEELRSQLLVMQGFKKELESCLVAESRLRRQLQERLLDIKGTIRVFCRLRPPNSNETCHDGSYVLSPNNQELTINQIIGGQQQRHKFVFDQVFDKNSTNADIFAEVDLLVQSAFNGFNACVFAYGQTGSGKTHTMLGEGGIVYQSMRTLFELVDTVRVQAEVKVIASFMEIYNDKVIDLISESSDAKELVTRECRDLSQLESVLHMGLCRRKVASTAMNVHSSRSHTIFSIMIKSTDLKTGLVTSGKVNLIDLAGSERLKRSLVTGKELQEAKAINTSLTALGNVIQALATKQKHVPFRSSKLTFTLQESLQGKCKTLMLVNLSPSLASLGESLTSLRFAEKVNSVKLDRAKLAP